MDSKFNAVSDRLYRIQLASNN